MRSLVVGTISSAPLFFQFKAQFWACSRCSRNTGWPELFICVRVCVYFFFFLVLGAQDQCDSIIITRRVKGKRQDGSDGSERS